MLSTYPVIITPDDNNTFCIYPPDLPGCVLNAETISGGLDRMRDAIADHLYTYETNGREKPEPSDPRLYEDYNPETDDIAYVQCDVEDYSRRINARAVRCSVSIPEWMKQEAEKRRLNLSRLLQAAVERELAR